MDNYCPSYDEAQKWRVPGPQADGMEHYESREPCPAGDGGSRAVSSMAQFCMCQIIAQVCPSLFEAFSSASMEFCLLPVESCFYIIDYEFKVREEVRVRGAVRRHGGTGSQNQKLYSVVRWWWHTSHRVVFFSVLIGKLA